LPAGPITFGHAYDVFPFDNRITRVELSSAQLQRVLADQLPQLIDGRRGLLSVSGVRVTVTCGDAGPELRLTRESGSELKPTDKLIVAAASYSAGRAAWATVEGEAEVVVTELPLLVRDVVAAWLVGRGGHIGANDFIDPKRPRWELPAQGPVCTASG